MVLYPLCTGCGKFLSCLQPAFIAIKTDMYKKVLDKNKNIHIETIDMIPNALPPLEKVFKALEVNKDCCRICLMQHYDPDWS